MTERRMRQRRSMVGLRLVKGKGRKKRLIAGKGRQGGRMIGKTGVR